MSNTDMEIESSLKAALTERIGSARFDLWFGEPTRFCLHEQTLRVDVANPFLQEYLRSNFQRELAHCCEQLLGFRPTCEFHVVELATTTAAPVIPKIAAEIATSMPVALVPTTRSQPAARTAGRSRADLPANPPLPARAGRPFQRMENFVVGSANRYAHHAVQMVLEQPGSVTPLFLYGPTGVGKTHLLEAIWTAFKTRQRGKLPLYQSAEQFLTTFLEALHGSGLPSFRRKYRGVDLLILDDLHFLCGKKATVVELLHTIDTLQREGKQIVLAADRPVSELSALGPEFCTRVEAGLACKLEPPDYETRLGILRGLAEKMSLDLPQSVHEFIATHLSSHARELQGAIHCLHATSRISQQPISLAMAEEALNGMIQNSQKAIRLVDIEKAVCSVFQVDQETLHHGATRDANYPRMLAMWLARKHTRAALTEIGRFFGRKSHSTVIAAQRKVTDWVVAGETLPVADRNLSAEEAIRRVEAQLKVG